MGVFLSDEALVMNSGEAPVILNLYAADGITAVNGGIAFAKEGEESSGVNRWVSLAVTEIALEPGEESVVPFTITVPPDASPGQHVAGLVVAAPPSEEGGGQFVVNVIQQAGVAVVIEVPGPRGAGLENTGAASTGPIQRPRSGTRLHDFVPRRIAGLARGLLCRAGSPERLCSLVELGAVSGGVGVALGKRSATPDRAAGSQRRRPTAWCGTIRIELMLRLRHKDSSIG